MTESRWKESLTAFFAERGAHVDHTPTLEDLCYVSGRDPRLWSQPELYDDLVGSIVDALDAGLSSKVLEVGCASGFLAKGVAPKVREYYGVDLAKPALNVARRLGLTNAEFKVADGTRLPFADGTFDAAFCYDVFTNFPRFEDGAGIIREMVRVVRRGGRVLVGSIPDEATRERYEALVPQVSAQLEAAFGAVRQFEAPQREPSFVEKVRDTLFPPAPPALTCYYFNAADFEAAAHGMGASVSIAGIHSRNPYVGCRFNVVYTKK